MGGRPDKTDPQNGVSQTDQITDRQESQYPAVQTDIKILRAVNLGHFEVQNRGGAPYRSIKKPMFFQCILTSDRGPRNRLSARKMGTTIICFKFFFFKRFRAKKAIASTMFSTLLRTINSLAHIFGVRMYYSGSIFF